jgi:copper chaperone CopZ
MAIMQFEVFNVKCGGCAHTLSSSLEDEFGPIEINLDADPRVITVDIEPGQESSLKIKLKKLGYPLASDELKSMETITTTAKSYVSCAIGKIKQK